MDTASELPDRTIGVVDVNGWTRQDVEEIGARDKVWLRAGDDTAEESWLFKQGRPRGLPESGSDLWAEVLAAKVASLAHLPAAQVRFAELNGVRGVISRGIGSPMEHGNELLSARITGYERDTRGPVPGYTLDSIADVLSPFRGSEEGLTAFESFAGYLAFDALVGNTDRHHENWAVISTTRALAPTYDHGASLGFNVPPRRRADVHRVADRARSRHFSGRPTLVDLAALAFDRLSATAANLWISRIDDLDLDALQSHVDAVPELWMSEGARTFVLQLVAENRRRLLCLLS